MLPTTANIIKVFYQHIYDFSHLNPIFSNFNLNLMNNFMSMASNTSIASDFILMVNHRQVLTDLPSLVIHDSLLYNQQYSDYLILFWAIFQHPMTQFSQLLIGPALSCQGTTLLIK
ncbi:hypothetical protein pb186bvf_019853 [Paramecium bursaria]